MHLSTLRADGSPRNWVVRVGLEDEHILVCTSDAIWKAKDMRRDPRVALSVTDMANPYRMAAVQGRVVEVRPDKSCRYMDPISFKYTGAPFPSRGPDRVCFVICGGEGGRADTRLRPQSRNGSGRPELAHRRSAPFAAGHRHSTGRPGAPRV